VESNSSKKNETTQNRKKKNYKNCFKRKKKREESCNVSNGSARPKDFGSAFGQSKRGGEGTQETLHCQKEGEGGRGKGDNRFEEVWLPNDPRGTKLRDPGATGKRRGGKIV